VLPIPHPAVVYRAVSDGAVLLSTADEVYYGLNAVGARVWELLPPVSRTVEELCATVAAGYPETEAATIRADVLELLQTLEAHGLLQRVSDVAADR